MNEPLRPSTLGEILDHTIQIYRARFWTFVGIATIPALAMLGLHLANVFWLHLDTIVHPSQKGHALWSIIVSTGFYHVAAILSVLISPALVCLTVAATDRKDCSIFHALRFIIVRWRSYLWVSVLKLSGELLIPVIIVLLLFVVTVLIVSLPGAIIHASVISAVGAWFVLALLIFGGGASFLFMGSSLSLTIPASAIEGLCGFKTIRRSWMLSKGTRPRIILTWVMVCLCSLTLQLSAFLVVRLIFSCFYHGHFASQQTYRPTVYFINAIVSALIGPIYPIAITLFYYDQRIRKEGYDIERMMEAAGLHAPDSSSVPEAVSAPEAAAEGVEA